MESNYEQQTQGEDADHGKFVVISPWFVAERLNKSVPAAEQIKRTLERLGPLWVRLGG
jgi:hypothetical protein